MENNTNVDKNGFRINYNDGYGVVIGLERWGSLGGWNEIYATDLEQMEAEHYENIIKYGGRL